MRAPHRLLSTAALLAAILAPACGYLCGDCGEDAGTAHAHQDGDTAGAAGAVADAAPDVAPDVATVGLPAPDFTLTDLAGNTVTLSELTGAGKTVVLEWFNPDCPVSKAYHYPEQMMAPIANEYAAKDVAWLAINSGGPGLQGHGLERNQRAVDEFAIPFPVLLDESGETGKRYAAKRTPHMYVIDSDGILRYAGAIDDGNSRTPGDVNYVRQALDQLLADAEITVPTSTAFGCSVKYAKTYE
ncbi:MAG: thioredoxin family protein [Planctomycetota bacterium]|jgi:peroxiredoxin